MSLSSEVHPLPGSSYRVERSDDDGYDGDDERGAISNFQSPTLEHARHDHIISNTVEDSTCPGTEAGGIVPQSSHSNDGRKAAAMPSFGQAETRSWKMGVRQHRKRAHGTGSGTLRAKGKGRGSKRKGGEIVSKTIASTG